MKTSRQSVHCRMWDWVCITAFLFVAFARADAAERIEPDASRETSPLDSGRAVGEFVPQFYSRVVTGPLMNRSVCYVCRYGERPVVMVVMRKIGPELRPLLKNVDRIVEANRARGLRSVGVYLSEESFPAISRVQTFGFNNHIAMPLTVGTEAVASESCQNVSNDAAVTVVFYNKRRVIQKFALRADELDVAHFTPVIDSLKTFAADHGAAAPLVESEAEPEPVQADASDVRSPG